MVESLHALVLGLALVGGMNAAYAQTRPMSKNETIHTFAEPERLAKENGTWIYPWVLNGRAHCPSKATPRGSLEKESQWTTRSLHMISLFVSERTDGSLPRNSGIELACGYAGGYELIAGLPASCRFTNTALTTEHISETLPKPRNGFITSCNLYDHSVEECEIQCVE